MLQILAFTPEVVGNQMRAWSRGVTNLTSALEGPHWSLMGLGVGKEIEDREASRGAASPVPGLARFMLAELESVRVREGGRMRSSWAGFHRHPHGYLTGN